MTEFNKYQHLERLGTTGVEGITSGICHVFPKLDGTNASVWINEEGVLKAGSRNRELSLEKDNAGFYRWVLDNSAMFEHFFFNHPEKRLYGEWLVPHSLKTYREDAWRKFYVFDVKDELDEYMHYDSYSPILKEHGFDYLSPLCIIKNGDDESFRKVTEKNTVLIEEGQGVGEGIVIKNYGWKNSFGHTIWAKVITNAFKEVHYKEMGAPEIGGKSLEEKIVDDFVTLHLVNKTYDKIKVANDGSFTGRDIPRLLQTVFYDLITEEMWEILKKHKNPKIDFKFLQRLTTQRVKEFRSDLF